MTAMLNGTERHAAIAAFQTSLAEGEPFTGAQLGDKFNRSDRWGRKVIAEARTVPPDARAVPPVVPARAAAPDTEQERHDSAERHEAPEHDHAGVGEAMPSERDRSLLDTVVVLVVALVAAAASYGHMYEVALLAGENMWIARAFPITVDGLVVAALRRGEHGRGWLALGLVVSVAANVVAQFPELAADAGPVVSAWPPLALYGTHRLLHRSR